MLSCFVDLTALDCSCRLICDNMSNFVEPYKQMITMAVIFSPLYFVVT